MNTGHRILELEGLLRLAIDMRRAQRRYFRTRDRADLQHAVAAEADFDREAARIIQRRGQDD